MENNRIDSKKIRLGKITYFDVDHNGSLVPPYNAYVFMINVDGEYINPFNEKMNLPVFDRVPYANTTLDGEDYGSKIVHVQGEITNGPCIVLEKIDIGEYFDEKELSIDMIKEYMMRSDKFFVDRERIYEEEIKNNGILKNVGNRIINRKQHIKISKDGEIHKDFDSFIQECEDNKRHYKR